MLSSVCMLSVKGTIDFVVVLLLPNLPFRKEREREREKEEEREREENTQKQ